MQQWERVHNRHPDLSSHVEMAVAEGVGTTVLTGTQRDTLHRVLSELDLRGRHPVELDDPGRPARPPGNELVLRVSGRRVEIPADGRRPPRPCDPAPLAFVLASLQMFRGASSTLEHVPVGVETAGIALFLGAAWWSHRRLVRLGLGARSQILRLTIAVAAVYTVTAELTMQNAISASGSEVYPLGIGILVVAMLGGLYQPGMSKRDRWTLGAGAAALVAIGWFLHPTHDHPSHLALGLLWPGTVYLAGLRLARELVVAEADYVRDLDEASAASVDRSFSDGQRIVLDLAREARDDARAQLRRIEHDLDAVLRQAAARRLHEIDRRLASVMAATPRRDCSDHVGATSEPVLAPLHSSRPGPEVAELAD